jgi:hypothetical protein
MIKVKSDTYALFEYTPYFVCDKEVSEKPKDLTYDLGDVVYIKTTNAIGVVLGCIDEVRENVRTDMDGMQGYCDIRPATMEDFKIKGVRFTDRLLGELTRKGF